MGWVIEHSPHKGADLVVLLMLANHAHADGTGSHPSLATLARETRMSRRQVIRIVERLEVAGAIRVARGASEWGTNLYTIVMSGGVNLSPTSDAITSPAKRTRRTASGGDKPPAEPVSDDAEVVTFSTPASDMTVSPKPSSTKPSLEPSLTEPSEEREAHARADELRHVLADVLYQQPFDQLPTGMQGRVTDAALELAPQPDATPDEIRRRVAIADATWSERAMVTPAAIAGQWPALGRPRSPNGRNGKRDREPTRDELRDKHLTGKYAHLFNRSLDIDTDDKP